MDFIDQLQSLSSTIPKQMDKILTEESTKHALVLPFISALGYNVFNPSEVVPEYNADFGTKIADKCDYAIFLNGSLIMLIECKWAGKDLEKKDEDQLRQYFAACPAVRFGVLTNGLVYRFFSDTESHNTMDEKPFLEFDMRDVKQPLVKELKRFTKSTFDAQLLANVAEELKYTTEIKRIVTSEFATPSPEFVKFFASQVYPGKKVTQHIIEKFSVLTKNALKHFVSDRIADTLKSAQTALDEQDNAQSRGQDADDTENDVPEDGIATTPEEMEAYQIIRAILYELVNPERVAIRDKKKYCGILLDDSQRKPICRFYFDGPEKCVGLFDSEKNEEKVLITQLSDLFSCSERLRDCVRAYDQTPMKSARNKKAEHAPADEGRGEAGNMTGEDISQGQ